MQRKRLTILPAAALAAVLMVWLSGVASGAGSQAKKQSAANVATVTVVAGKPSELSFKLSKSSLIPVGKVIFKVTNGGRLVHDFKVCVKAVATSKASTCNGTGTKKIQPGKAALPLTVTFKTKGKYEFLCTVPGHAGAGMKGLLGIGVKLTAADLGGTTVSTTPSSTVPTSTVKTTTTATTPAAPRETLLGDPAAGAGVFSSADPPCGSCHTLRAAGANGNVGPDLDGVKPGQDLVVQRVTNGINVMPPYGGSLSQTQIRNLAAYVYNATHPQ